MRLTDLDAEFIRLEGKYGGTSCFDANGHMLDITEAQGVMFQCPKCAADTKEPPREYLDAFRGPRRCVPGAHYLICWFVGRGVPDDVNPKPGRWHVSGTGLDDLTFVGPDAASVLLTTGCWWHGFVRDGDAS